MKQQVGSLDGLSILLVDDEVLVAMALREHLLDGGASRVDLTYSLSQTEETFARSDYDAVILDIRLPDGNSNGFARQLLSDGVALVIHSGHAQSTEENGLDAALFCSKPATPSEVIASVRDAVDRATQ